MVYHVFGKIVTSLLWYIFVAPLSQPCGSSSSSIQLQVLMAAVVKALLICICWNAWYACTLSLNSHTSDGEVCMWPEASVENLWLCIILPVKIDFAEVDNTITLTASISDENRLRSPERVKMLPLLVKRHCLN